MTEEPNLREVERRAYMSYHQDGLLDMFVGLYILGFGFGVFVDVVLEFGMGMILASTTMAAIIPIWIAAKRRITMPRIGFVKFGTGGTAKLMAIFIGTMVAGGFGAFAFALAALQGGMRLWVDFIFQNGMIIVGLASLAVGSLFGYSMGLKRLYAYGLLALIALVFGHFAGIFFGYILMALGTAVTIAGVVLLIGFVRRFPLQGEEAIAN